MNDVVISGRIPIVLMNRLKEFNKNNTQILNEALELYVKENSTTNQRIQDVYKQEPSDEYVLLCKTLDSVKRRLNGSF